MFGKKSTTAAADRTGVCLGCHLGKNQMFWASSTHASRDLSCDTCHQVHNNGHDKVREKKTQAEVCFACHKNQRIQVSKPSRHPVLEGKVTCSDCHNPHGSAGPTNLARDTVNDTCYKCHTEKRGPFIWGHQPVTENCSYCHDPHGTTVANLLKMRSPFLCQQCHEPNGHRGVAPVFSEAGDYGTRVLFARGCLNCHTNIHGSNNPQNSTNSRLFRR
jgi:DmsE family decaheme c-type cytochrome